MGIRPTFVDKGENSGKIRRDSLKELKNHKK